LPGAHVLARGPEALKTQHVRAVGADLAVIAVLRLACAAASAEMTVLTMIAAALAV